jgi:HAD superfamily hydrolase (TIGR01450 family)
MLWVLDLDGVVWLSGRPIPGSPDAIERLRRHGDRVVFLTNNSGPTLAELALRLSNAGIQIDPAQLATSAQAAASLLKPDSTAMVIGGEGIHEALIARRIRLVAGGDRPDTVVVGRTVKLDYDELAMAASAIRRGARFVATNTDPTFPTPQGLVPGGGALVAFLAVAAGQQPEVAGKPHPPAAALVRHRYGAIDVVVGDRADTDGAFARLVNARFALVLSGSTSPQDLPVDPPPDVTGDNLAMVVDRTQESG